jgi:hypothetical protein
MGSRAAQPQQAQPGSRKAAPSRAARAAGQGQPPQWAAPASRGAAAQQAGQQGQPSPHNGQPPSRARASRPSRAAAQAGQQRKKDCIAVFVKQISAQFLQNKSRNQFYTTRSERQHKVKIKKAVPGTKVNTRFHGAKVQGEISYLYPVQKDYRHTMVELEIVYQNTIFSVSRYLYEITAVPKPKTEISPAKQ